MKSNTSTIQTKNPLWTRDFTIITVGSVISILGNVLSGFAMDLMVLDYTGSTLMFAIYNMLYLLPNALAPILIGPFLDRFSRKKTIYVLDFLTAGLFAVMSVILYSGQFSFIVLAVVNFLLGGIGGIYYVAYDSFYPLLVSEGNYQKAYSVSSTLETLSVIMVPLSTLIYRAFGIVPLFMANTATYLIAAIMEMRIRTEEKYISARAQEDGGKAGLRRFTGDFMEGLRYLAGEKGLLAIAIYFLFSSVTGGMTGVVTLPYFRSVFENGEYIYTLTWGMGSLARLLIGIVHYNVRMPAKAKYNIALTVYISLCLLEGSYLFFSVPIMMAMTFTTGLLGMTSYNIRIAATQKYVPDEKKGRFNGAFGTLSTVGAFLGQAAAGALSLAVSERTVVVLANALCLLAALIFIGGRKKDVERIYNVET